MAARKKKPPAKKGPRTRKGARVFVRDEKGRFAKKGKRDGKPSIRESVHSLLPSSRKDGYSGSKRRGTKKSKKGVADQTRSPRPRTFRTPRATPSGEDFDYDYAERVDAWGDVEPDFMADWPDADHFDANGVPLDERGVPLIDYMEEIAERDDVDVSYLYDLYYGYIES